VYKLVCDRCPASYYGQSTNLFNRFGQHIGDLRNKREHGALVPHYQTEHEGEGLPAEPTERQFRMEPIWLSQDPEAVSLLESIIIYNKRAQCLNRGEGPALNNFSREIV
jgi:hypothetical protein